jgi:hypothetical protein
MKLRDKNLLKKLSFSPRANVQLVIVSITAVVCGWWLLRTGRGQTFFFDEWDFLAHRFFNVEDVLRPHNGHFSALPVVVFIMFRNVWGVSSYVPFQVIGILVHLSVCTGVYVLLARRSKSIAYGSFLVVALLGSGWQNILWPFQIGMMGALSFGIWSLVEIDRKDTSATRLSILVGLALMSAGGGVAVALVFFAVIVWRRKVLDIVKVAIPICLYGLWYLKYGVSQSTPENIGLTPQFVLDSARTAAAGIGGRTTYFGAFILGGILVTLILSFWKVERKLTVLAAMGIILFTWMMTGVSRAQLGEPGASRYVYIGAIMLIVVWGLLINSPSRWFVVLALLATPFLIQGNMKVMRAGAGGLFDTSIHVKARFAAVEIVGNSEVVGYRADPSRTPQINSSEYLALVKNYGSPAYTTSQVATLPDPIRAEADRVIMEMTPTVRLVTWAVDRSCPNKASKLLQDISIPVGQKIKIVTDRTLLLGFRWFADQPIEGTSILLSEAGTYEISNLRSLRSPVLRLYGVDLVDVCASP